MEPNKHSQFNNIIFEKIQHNIPLTSDEKQDILKTLIREYDFKNPIPPDDLQHMNQILSEETIRLTPRGSVYSSILAILNRLKEEENNNLKSRQSRKSRHKSRKSRHKSTKSRPRLNKSRKKKREKELINKNKYIKYLRNILK
tara:strand:+ start:5077 stop:5505 length:429 start_codon:yes stop_codon:yes gene_type:complete